MWNTKKSPNIKVPRRWMRRSDGDGGAPEGSVVAVGGGGCSNEAQKFLS